jgi:hypothetical protein
MIHTYQSRSYYWNVKPFVLFLRFWECFKFDWTSCKIACLLCWIVTIQNYIHPATQQYISMSLLGGLGDKTCGQIVSFHLMYFVGNKPRSILAYWRHSVSDVIVSKLINPVISSSISGTGRCVVLISIAGCHRTNTKSNWWSRPNYALCELNFRNVVSRPSLLYH